MKKSKNIFTNIDDFLTEQEEFDNSGLGTPPIQRFDRALYLTYVEQNRKFKHVTKKVFYDELFDKLDKVESKDFDKTRIYKLADSKDIWWSKNHRVLGEVWKEDDMVSYWINTEI